MQLSTIVNILGVAAAVIYVGSVLGASYMPLYAIIAAGLFLIGLFYPFIREYAELRRGFASLEDEFMQDRNKALGQGPDVEVFAEGRRTSVWRRSRRSSWTVVLMLCLAIGLLGYDMATYWMEPAKTAKPPATISNF